MPSSKTQVDISEAFSRVRQRFEQSLPVRAEAMLELVLQHKTGNELGRLKAETHKLAGACGTFGYPQLGTLARKIEQYISNISALSAEKQSVKIPELNQMLYSFKEGVAQALSSTSPIATSNESVADEPRAIWLLLNNQLLISELVSQLNAFGLTVVQLADFDSCLRMLQTETPALLFTQIEPTNGTDLFKQNLLLNTLQQRQSRLLVFSDNDDFELRIKAAQHYADDFFVSPLDVPNMISRISELLEQSSGGKGRVYIVDDDAMLAEHYALVLNRIGIDTFINKQPQQIVKELINFQPDLILMDMYMPDYTGAELAGVIRQYPPLRRLPIVFLSSEQNKNLQNRAMSHGADDFITKPIDDLQLAQAVKVRLARSMQIKNLVEKDSLTGLIKHSAIKEVAEFEFERAGRTGKPLSIVMLDIDHFKTVNDAHGHATGDIVITALATLMRKRIRKTDRAGRYGGEEFMLVLPDCDAEQARLLTKQILENFAILHFDTAGQPFGCTFSAGVASSADSQAENAEQLINHADEALYRAKHAGRNQVC
ncbi:response regulator receiver modulated diguanylate cyclase [Arsukibacterium tuosuense]|uniref:diguanylate cyclase n=1 Tax=Arsukibacterium tuosuense TaxID=1323745 RepID=A0A285J1R4_9GAMM|nr:diguanylate cyclase [Arsukibacterium tuosuense]SNY54249.1 response regulator receiver modulated diguanylate cyclase [Arsukibacterium tuosuense]